MNILDDFLELENKERLFERTYNGIPYWQALRFDIYILITYNKAGISCAERISSKSQVIEKIDILKGMIYDLKNWHLLSSSDILYMDEQSKREVDGKLVDPYFDFWKFEEIGSINRCLCHGYNKQGLSSMIGTAIPDFFYEVIWFFGKFKRKKQDSEEKYIKQLSKKINRKFGEVISEKELLKRVYRVVIYHHIYGRYYKKLLDKVRPKAILLKCYYSNLYYPLFNIAKKRGITVIELQHGQVCNHIAYNYGDLSSTGKEVPDYIFTYGEFWSRYMTMPQSVKIIAVGSSFLDNRKEKYKEICPDEKKIVFYSNLEVGKDMQKLIIEFLEKNGDGNYKLYLKLHPEELESRWEENYQVLINNPNVEIVMGDREIYGLLATIKHHVSVTSTVLYEALKFDTERYIFKAHEALNAVQPLIDLNLAHTFKTVEEFIEMLQNSSVKSNMETINGQVWKENARKNGQRIISELISSKEDKV